MPKVLHITLDSNPDGGEPELEIVTFGYPNEAINLAHDIATPIFSDRGAWHFTQIVCIPPEKAGLLLDSQWRVETKSRLKDPARERIFEFAAG